MTKLNRDDDFSKPPPECDALCPYRSCYQPGYNKGSYSPGRGYTSYYEKPIYVCMTRMLHGCGYNRTAKTVDMDRLVKDLQAKKGSMKVSVKASRFVDEMIKIISMLGEKSQT